MQGPVRLHRRAPIDDLEIGGCVNPARPAAYRRPDREPRIGRIGSGAGLLRPVEFFNLILGTKLAPQEKQDLVAFLRAL
jgi:hypothetical protein